jgi:hypothetical protein
MNSKIREELDKLNDRLESIEFDGRISGLSNEVDELNRKFDLLMKFLKLTYSKEPRIEEKKNEKT